MATKEATVAEATEMEEAVGVAEATEMEAAVGVAEATGEETQPPPLAHNKEDIQTALFKRLFSCLLV